CRHLIPPLTTPPPSYIYTLSLHDALPIFRSRKRPSRPSARRDHRGVRRNVWRAAPSLRTSTIGCGTHRRTRESHRARNISPYASDRKSTRLNSSHLGISYAVFCLKKKKKK